MKKWVRSFLFIALIWGVLGGVSNASEATIHRHQHAHHGVHRSHHRGVRHRYSDGRPSAWCGWQMRQWFPGHETDRPGLNLDMARDWGKVGSATNAHVGAVVVWPHHVGFITGYDTGRHLWIVKSGNDGHQVKERPRSVAGAIFRDL